MTPKPQPYAVDFRGHWACPCQVEWIPIYEAELQRRGLLVGPITIYQLIGGAPQSGGTHVDGGASDFLDLPNDHDLAVWVARQMGADATWHRPPNWDGNNGIEHDHSVLRNCPHNLPARYQITAVDAGFNGLGHLGEGAPDNGPRPLSGRTWQEGIAWAQQQEDIVTPEDIANIAAAVLAAKPTNSDLSVGDLLKRAEKAAVEARDLLAAANKAAKKP